MISSLLPDTYTPDPTPVIKHTHIHTHTDKERERAKRENVNSGYNLKYNVFTLLTFNLES